MAFDDHKNFAYSTVLTAPSPANSGTSLVVQGGDGAKFPTPPFNATVWPAGQQPTSTNAEIVRVTSIGTDTFGITRGTESSNTRSILVGDQICNSITDKVLTDVETATTTNLYKFRAYRSAAYSMAASATTKFPFDAVSFDSNSNFDTTNNRYTCPVSGFYLFSTHIYTAATATRLLVMIYKNGIEAGRMFDVNTGASQTGGGNAQILQAAAGDYFEIFYFNGTTGGNTIAGELYNWFSGYLISQM